MTILCIATYFKGDPFLRECKALGCTVLLLTTDKLVGAEWPRESIDEIHSVPRDASDEAIRHHVDKIARRHRIDRIAALDDFDVELAAMLREHLRVPGMGRTTASRFRDKLAMRMQARTLGVPVPEFSAVFNDQDVSDWAARVTPPWVLKPRSSAAAIGIKKVDDRDALWRALEAAGDDRGGSACSSSSCRATSTTSIRSCGTARSCSRWRSSTAGRRWRCRTKAVCSSRAGCRTTPPKPVRCSR